MSELKATAADIAAAEKHCGPMGDKTDYLAGVLAERQSGYTPDVRAAQAHLQRLFNECGDGSGTLPASWVICIATKALEALSEGIRKRS